MLMLSDLAAHCFHVFVSTSRRACPSTIMHAGPASRPSLFLVCLPAQAAACVDIFGYLQRRILRDEGYSVPTRRRKRQEPKHHAITKDCFHVAQGTTAVSFAFKGWASRLFAKLDRGHRLEHKVCVKNEERRQQEPHDKRQRFTKQNAQHFQERDILIPNDSQHREEHGPNYQVTSNGAIHNDQEKVLEVLEANAIVDPRTMVVHLQNTHATNAAMMATIGLEIIAPFALSLFAQSLLLKSSVSVDKRRNVHVLWDSSWMLHNASNVTRYQKNDDRVKDHEQEVALHDRLLISDQVYAMIPHVYEPRASYDATDESYRKKLQRLREAGCRRMWRCLVGKVFHLVVETV